MKKAILGIFMALIFVVACGSDDPTGVAKIKVNGVDFTKSVACTVTPADVLTISIGAADEGGNTISVGGTISKSGDDYEYVDGDTYSVSYSEGVMGSYTATDDDDDGTFTGSFKDGLVKINFDVNAKLNGMGAVKNLKGEIECTPGGAAD